ncbi:MAG: YbbR-like domain-containing protein [Candidatus Binatia bacterium]
MINAADRLKRLFLRDLGMKLFALLLACGLWYGVNFGSRDAEVTLPVPVQYSNLDARLTIVGRSPRVVTVWVAGSRTALDTLSREELLLDYDLSKASPGTTQITVDPVDLGLPTGTRLVRVSPARFSLTIAKRNGDSISPSDTDNASEEGVSQQ